MEIHFFTSGSYKQTFAKLQRNFSVVKQFHQSCYLPVNLRIWKELKMWSGHRHTSAEEKLLFVGVGLLLPHAEVFCFSLYTPLKKGKARARVCVCLRHLQRKTSFMGVTVLSSLETGCGMYHLHTTHRWMRLRHIKSLTKFLV